MIVVGPHTTKKECTEMRKSEGYKSLEIEYIHLVQAKGLCSWLSVDSPTIVLVDKKNSKRLG